MGGKGGGGGNFYQVPPDTSGYATPEEAAATLAKQAPLDLSKYQQAIDVNKAAQGATAPTVQTPTTTGSSGTTDTGSTAAAAVLAPPLYWNNNQTLQPSSLAKDKTVTTQT